MILLKLGAFILLSHEKQQSLQQLIIDILAKNIDGLTVDKLYIQLNLVKSCSLATIYRMLAEMRKLGVVRKTEFARQKAIYTISQQRLNCSVIDLFNNELSPCFDQDILIDFEKLLDKYKNEYASIDIVLYKK